MNAGPIVRLMALALAGIVLLALSPWLSYAAALAIRAATGCEIGSTDYQPPPCPILGLDISGTLEAMAYLPFVQGMDIVRMAAKFLAIWFGLALILAVLYFARRKPRSM